MSLHTLVEGQRAALHKGGVSDTEYVTADYRIGLDLGVAGKAMYIVVNRVFGVVEYATAVLPDAVSTMRILQDQLTKLRDTTGVVPPLEQ